MQDFLAQKVIADDLGNVRRGVLPIFLTLLDPDERLVENAADLGRVSI